LEDFTGILTHEEPNYHIFRVQGCRGGDGGSSRLWDCDVRVWRRRFKVVEAVMAAVA